MNRFRFLVVTALVTLALSVLASSGMADPGCTGGGNPLPPEICAFNVSE